MKYNSTYKDIFVSARCALDNELEAAFNFMSYGVDNGHKHSWSYIAIVANDLTAYNELSPFDFFVKLRTFK